MENEENTLYFGNLPYDVNELGLLAWIKKYGYEVLTVKIIREKNTMRSKGYAFVTFATDKDYIMAMDFLNEEVLGGRMLKVRSTDRPKPQEPFS